MCNSVATNLGETQTIQPNPSFHFDLPEFEFESEHLGENSRKRGENDDSRDVVEQGIGGDAGDLERRVQLLEQLCRQLEHVVRQTELLLLKRLLLHLETVDTIQTESQTLFIK